MQQEGGHVPSIPSEAHYVAVQQSPEFQELRRNYRGWVLPVAAASLIWYFAYVILAAYAQDFMSKKVVGNINVALIMGLLQFVTTFGVTALYIRHAGKVLDPASARIRDEMEEGGSK
ncbi:MAG: DUF485 domain-containing protein [Chloroflexota bacterium]|nr:DUF485 domain-containing protein [Chloroflexota bacterium]